MISAAKGQEVLSREFVDKWAGQFDDDFPLKYKQAEVQLKSWLRTRFGQGRRCLDKPHFVESQDGSRRDRSAATKRMMAFWCSR